MPIPSLYLRSQWKHNRTRKQYLNLIHRLQGVLNYEYLLCSDHCTGLSSTFWFRCSSQIARAQNKCSINHTLAGMIIKPTSKYIIQCAVLCVPYITPSILCLKTQHCQWKKTPVSWAKLSGMLRSFQDVPKSNTRGLTIGISFF